MIDFKVDIFSLGCIYHEMFFNLKLFNGMSKKDLLESNSKCDYNLSDYAT